MAEVRSTIPRFRSAIERSIRFFRRRRVLLLDDDASIRRLVTLILRRAGYRVDAVVLGNQAIELIDRNRYDAILLDLMMPHEGGATVLRHIRAREPRLLRRTFLLTAAPVTLLEGYRADLAGVIRKPFEAAELMRAVAQLNEAA